MQSPWGEFRMKDTKIFAKMWAFGSSHGSIIEIIARCEWRLARELPKDLAAKKKVKSGKNSWNP
jgi:hypothetical protein